MIKRSEHILFIEGTRDDTNGDLTLGFARLLEQKLKGRMPRIVMGNDNQETIRKYKNYIGEKVPHSLVDLDGKGTDATQGNYDIIKAAKKNRPEINLTDTDSVFFMVQKMEAWFLSQPNILSEYFKVDFDGKIPYDHPSKIEEPDTVLKTRTKASKKGAYHKVRDGSRLLEKLDLSALEQYFIDVKDLIKQLS